MRRWETLKNEAIRMEQAQARRHAPHRPAVTSASNPAANDPNTGAITTDGAKSSSAARHRSTHGEESTVTVPLARVLPERSVERTHDKQSQLVQYRKKNDLKLAFSEFYLMLVLIQNYQTLNFTGFRKILKKHDKLFQTVSGEDWR